MNEQLNTIRFEILTFIQLQLFKFKPNNSELNIIDIELFQYATLKII